jgi:hypothetical protein
MSFLCLALWPLFHYLLWQDVATEVTPESEHWNAYLKANEAFARKLVQIYRTGDLIWVHDYHLLLVPKIFRGHSKRTEAAYVGLFLHTPFPSSEVFRCLPSESPNKSHGILTDDYVRLRRTQRNHRWNARCKLGRVPKVLLWSSFRIFLRSCLWIRKCSWRNRRVRTNHQDPPLQCWCRCGSHQPGCVRNHYYLLLDLLKPNVII